MNYDLINPDDFTCTTYNVLVKIAKPEEVTSGGIILTEEATERNQHNEAIGTLVACGEVAFAGYTSIKFTNKPEIGDRVIFAKYAGTVFQDEEGNLYRFFQDKEIMGFARGK